MRSLLVLSRIPKLSNNHGSNSSCVCHRTTFVRWRLKKVQMYHIDTSVPPLRISCRSSSLGARHSPETYTVPTSNKALWFLASKYQQPIIHQSNKHQVKWRTFEKLRLESSTRVDSLLPHVADLLKDIDKCIFGIFTSLGWQNSLLDWSWPSQKVPQRPTFPPPEMSKPTPLSTANSPEIAQH